MYIQKPGAALGPSSGHKGVPFPGGPSSLHVSWVKCDRDYPCWCSQRLAPPTALSGFRFCRLAAHRLLVWHMNCAAEDHRLTVSFLTMPVRSMKIQQCTVEGSRCPANCTGGPSPPGVSIPQRDEPGTFVFSCLPLCRLSVHAVVAGMGRILGLSWPSGKHTERSIVKLC